MGKYTDIGIETHGHVGLIEIQRNIITKAVLGL